ncbi:site-specific DNA-methyltransferase [Ochrobactrum sp. MR34]|nr:site-specific DNA-methyltransferase [Ochrobactrum sp. MR34]
MPTLDWLGKKAVVKHHRDVPYRLIHCDKYKSYGDPNAGNLLVQGDNLEALKALLPYYAGKVKCVYIDPPYNTGNEAWVYNDNVNSPEIKDWLGKVVGKEAEDLSRHDKWLCMMYPRIRLLRDFLLPEGVIFISIDDDEVHSLRMLMDEIFGRKMYIGTFVWRRRTGSMDETGNFSRDHDYIVAYQRGTEGLLGDQRTFAKYSNLDNDPRGPWIWDNLSASKPGGDTYYAIQDPKTGNEYWPPKGRYWPYNPKTMIRKIEEGRISFPSSPAGSPLLKRFQNEAKSLYQPVSSWIGSTKEKDYTDEDGILHLSSPMNSEASKRIKEIFADKVFNYSKPLELITKLIDQVTSKEDIIIDSFAGSATTGHAVLNLNKRDGGKRRFILIEMLKDIAQDVSAERLLRVIKGYNKNADPTKPIEGLGGGFQFCTLGEPLFNADGNISAAVTYPDLAAHVFFCETGSPIPKRAEGTSSLIGTFQNRAIYLLHSADSLGVPYEKAGNVLTSTILDNLPLPDTDFSGARIIYAEGCTVPEDRLATYGVTFKQIPYQIEGV